MPTKHLDALAATVLVVCWSSGFVGAGLGTREAPVATVLLWRTLISAVVLGAWALLRRERASRRALLQQAVVGGLVQVLYLGGVFTASAAGVSAGTSALVAALQPLLVAAVGGPLLGERTTTGQRVGLGVAAAGVLLVVSGDVGGGTAAPLAYLLPVVALLGLTSGTVLERRWRPDVPLVSSLAVQTAVGAVGFAAVAGFRGEVAPPMTDGFWLAMAWLVVLAALGGYGSYLLVVRRSGATRASTLLFLTPPTTALLAWLLLGQVPGVLAIPGVAVCAVGVALALGARVRRRTAPRASACVASPAWTS